MSHSCTDWPKNVQEPAKDLESIELLLEYGFVMICGLTSMDGSVGRSGDLCSSACPKPRLMDRLSPLFALAASHKYCAGARSTFRSFLFGEVMACV